MKLKLLGPASSLNWMLIAEELQDPAGWSQFLLNHGPDTERYRFEEAVQQSSAEKSVVVSCYRLLSTRGSCAFEYMWQTSPDTVRAHAQRVAELLQVPVDMPQSSATPLAS